MEHVPGSVVPPKVVTPSMLVTWWTAQIQNAPAAHTARLERLVFMTEATSSRGAGFQPAKKNGWKAFVRGTNKGQ